MLAGYAVLFPLVLPLGPGDYVQVVSSPWWVPLSAAAMLGLLCLLVGLDAVYASVRATAGMPGWLGLQLLKVALVLQACKVSWQLLLEPLIAAHPRAVFLIRESVILNDPSMTTFRLASAIAIIAGAVLFGAALYRSGLFSRVAVVLIGLGALVYAVGFMISVFVAVGGVVTLAVGCVMIGAGLWREPRHDWVAADPRTMI